jgi:hypothetical protein
MVNQISENTTDREAFIAAWWQIDKAVKRFGGVLMVFAGGLSLAFDQPVDQMTFLAAAALIAGGLTLIIFSRRPADARVHLYFLQQSQLSTRGMIAGFGAVFLLYQATQTQRPLFWIMALIVGGIAVWYQWRAAKVSQYTELYKRDDALKIEDEIEEEVI